MTTRRRSGKLAGQLGYLFDDDPSLRDAPVAQLVARLNEQDRLARAIAKYPNRTDAEIHRPPGRVPRPHRGGRRRAGPPAGARAGS